MMKSKVKILTLFLVLLVVFGFSELKAHAAGIRYFQTVEDNIVTRQGPAESYKDKLKYIAKKGTVLKVVDESRNIWGNLWYKLDNNYWVYSKRVTAHTHSYYGGICKATGCGYEPTLKQTAVSMTVRVTNKDGAKAWSRPYSNNSTHITTYKYGTDLSVVAKVTNIGANGKPDNLWYKLSNGRWIYSGNVTQICTLSYSASGASGAPAAQKYLSGSSVTVSTAIPKKNGYDFKGWSTSSAAKTVNYKGGNKFTIKSNVTLYAVWSPCSHVYFGGICKKCNYTAPLTVTNISGIYSVTNKDGAKAWSRPYSNNSVHKKTYAKGTELKVIAKTTNIGEDGKPDNLWYKLENGTWIYSGNVVQIYTLTYSASGASGTPAAQKFVSGSAVTVSNALPKKNGYDFMGWSTSSSAQTVNYKAGSQFTPQSNVTLYAVWSPCSHVYFGGICKKCNYTAPLTVTNISGVYTVTNKAGARAWSRPYSNNSVLKKTYAKGTELKVIAKTTNIGVDGKLDNLWYKLEDGTWIYSGDVAERYMIKYNANGGTGAPANQFFLSGSSVKVTSAKPSRVGYVFQGWATSSSSSKISYKAGNSYSGKKNLYLYAVWKKCGHSKYSGGICTQCKYEYKLKETSLSTAFVVTNDNGAPAWSRPYSINSKKVKIYDKNAAFSVVAKVKNINEKGKADNVWYKLKDGTWVYSGNVTERFMIKYYANGGTNPPANTYFLSGKSATVTKSQPSREGYIFKGWSTKSDAKKASYEAGDKHKKDKNLYLYAVWEKCSHKYNDSGKCTKCKYQYKVTASKSGAGSYVVTEADGAVIRKTPYEVGTKVKTAKQYSLLTVVGSAKNAHKNLWYKLDDGSWVYSDRIAVGYKVTYDANSGKGAPGATGFVSGKLTVSSTIPKRDNYQFMGWSTSKTATSASYKTGDTYNVKKNITLYAVWKKCSHNFKNNYGICKNCKGEYPLTVKSTADTVYEVNNKNGTATYKRPYSKSSEKVKTFKNKTLMLIVGSAKNANDELWYKLKDGTWIKGSEVKKKTTYNTIDSLPHTYALSMINAIKDYEYTGAYDIKTISGVQYIYWYGKNTFYLKKDAFTGKANNTQLSSVNKKLTTAANERSSTTEKFAYATKSSKTIKKLSYSCDYENYKQHTHYIWKINALSAKSGITGSDGVVVRCQNDGETAYIEWCCSRNAIEDSFTTKATLAPKFTVSTTPCNDKDGDPVGWFTDFKTHGKGYQTKNFNTEDYIELASCVIKGTTPVVKFVVAPTPSNALKAIKGMWSFTEKVNKYNGSASFSAPDYNPLTYIDKKTNTAYRTYTMTVKSPITIRSQKDYLEAQILLHKLQKSQKISVKLYF